MKKIKLIECPYCGKMHTTRGLCNEKKLYGDSFTSFLKEKKAETIYLHTKDGLAAKDISLQMAKTFKKTTPAIMRYKIDNVDKSVQDVRDILKEANVYTKITTGTQSRRESTLKQRYGVTNNGQSVKARKMLLARNNASVFHLQISDSMKQYKKDVVKYTNRSRRSMPKPVTDYYTGLPFIAEFMDPGLMQGDLYPTIDHKQSVQTCFALGITAEVCSDKSNLCWTYRIVNSIKGAQNEEEFIFSNKDFFVETISPEIKALISKGHTTVEENK